MDDTPQEIERLKNMVDTARQEIELAIMFHETWRPTAYDTGFHARIGTSHVRLDVPDEVFDKAMVVSADNRPVGWDAIPTGRVSLDVGEAWATEKKSALLLVPSVIVPEEFNVLINPQHPDAQLSQRRSYASGSTTPVCASSGMASAALGRGRWAKCPKMTRGSRRRVPRRRGPDERSEQHERCGSENDPRDTGARH
jgi:hypothetical protein